jgi:hypothetical protein
MKQKTYTAAAAALGCAVLAGILVAQHQPVAPKPAQPKEDRNAPNTGYSDTPVIPGQKWKVHDAARPAPRKVTPGAQLGQPPSDATVLFDGKDLSQWLERGKGSNRGKVVPATWKVENGYMESSRGTGDVFTKEKFGDMQLHIEWASPAVIDGASQWRGNSGVLLMSRYEIQVLDSWENPTYADGQAGAIYGWWPPLVNVARKPGEWQAYDIVFEAPRWAGDKLERTAFVTVFHNGVLLHHRQEIGGPMAHRVVRQYQKHEMEEPLALQNHDTLVRYRNIWARKLRPYDQP